MRLAHTLLPSLAAAQAYNAAFARQVPSGATGTRVVPFASAQRNVSAADAYLPTAYHSLVPPGLIILV